MADGVGVSAEVGTQDATVPALFVIGPQRTGTSWIYEYLASEPGVYLDRSRKENYFFDRSRPHSPAGDRRRLLSLFTGSGPVRLMADVNPIYLGRRHTLDRLLAAFPEARLVYIHRDDDERHRSFALHQEFNQPSSTALRLLRADNLYVTEADRAAQHDFMANETELRSLPGLDPERLLRLDHADLAADGGRSWVEALADFTGVDLGPPPELGRVYATRSSRRRRTRLAFVPVRVAQAAGLHRPVHRRRHRSEAAARGWTLRPLSEADASTLARPGRRRVLQVITRADSGGAQHHVADVIEALSADHEMVLAVGDEGPLTERVRALGHRVEVVPELGRAIHPAQDRRAVAALGQVIDDVGPDLLHAHSSKAGLVARMAGRRRRVPVVFTAHGWVFAPQVPTATRAPVWLAEAVAGRLGHRIICLSEHDRDLARRQLRLPASALTVIPHGIDLDAPLADPGRQPATILMAARLQAQKDHDTLLTAIERLDRTDIRLRLAGDGPRRSELEDRVERLGLSDRVEFLGDRADVPGLLAEAQLFALVSHYEGLPISILEAMRAGLPVVASNVGGVADQVVDGATGRLVEQGDVAGLTRVLADLLDDPDVRARMGRAGRARVETHFPRSLMVDRLRRLYDEVVDGRPSTTTGPIETAVPAVIDLRDGATTTEPGGPFGATTPAPGRAAAPVDEAPAGDAVGAP